MRARYAPILAAAADAFPDHRCRCAYCLRRRDAKHFAATTADLRAAALAASPSANSSNGGISSASPTRPASAASASSNGSGQSLFPAGIRFASAAAGTMHMYASAGGPNISRPLSTSRTRRLQDALTEPPPPHPSSARPTRPTSTPRARPVRSASASGRARSYQAAAPRAAPAAAQEEEGSGQGCEARTSAPQTSSVRPVPNSSGVTVHTVDRQLARMLSTLRACGMLHDGRHGGSGTHSFLTYRRKSEEDGESSPVGGAGDRGSNGYRRPPLHPSSAPPVHQQQRRSYVSSGCIQDSPAQSAAQSEGCSAGSCGTPPHALHRHSEPDLGGGHLSPQSSTHSSIGGCAHEGGGHRRGGHTASMGGGGCTDGSPSPPSPHLKSSSSLPVHGTFRKHPSSGGAGGGGGGDGAGSGRGVFSSRKTQSMVDRLGAAVAYGAGAGQGRRPGAGGDPGSLSPRPGQRLSAAGTPGHPPLPLPHTGAGTPRAALAPHPPSSPMNRDGNWSGGAEGGRANGSSGGGAAGSSGEGAGAAGAASSPQAPAPPPAPATAPRVPRVALLGGLGRRKGLQGRSGAVECELLAMRARAASLLSNRYVTLYVGEKAQAGGSWGGRASSAPRQRRPSSAMV